MSYLLRQPFWILFALIQTASAPHPLFVYGADVKPLVAIDSKNPATAAAAEPPAAMSAAKKQSQKPGAQSDAQSADKSEKGVELTGRNPRVLFIVRQHCPACDEALAKLKKSGSDFDMMRSAGWKIGAEPDNNIQIVDAATIPEIVSKLAVKVFPTVCCIDKGEIVRSFHSGCTTPLDCWTLGFLAKGVDERPKAAVLETARVESTGHYPLRGNHWSIETDWNPTKPEAVAHLRGPNHGAQILPSQHIEDWSLEEVLSLHDDLHERELAANGGSSGSGNSGAKTYGRVKILGM
ncbi:MAG TPA: hypothetical protein VFE24_11350 [Pirellulales bacterium]|jgi:hypothetical protein|nr:hypothetical protein [Pirellulales bacterium]